MQSNTWKYFPFLQIFLPENILHLENNLHVAKRSLSDPDLKGVASFCNIEMGHTKPIIGPIPEDKPTPHIEFLSQQSQASSPRYYQRSWA